MELFSGQEVCAICQLEIGLSAKHAATRAIDLAEEFPPPAELTQGFEGLEVLDFLGAGGMGAVYLARQTKLDRTVALKIIRPEIAASPEFAQRFEREARALARLNHPNIVGIYDFGERDGMYFYLMEFVEGTNLEELANANLLSPNESLDIVRQICGAIQFAHENGVVHRDIKPTNILVNTSGAVKIADFGLAKLITDNASDPALTQTRQVFGTPRYMAPEQIESSREVDHRADIYSLGVVFYELLNGELPIGRFDPPSMKIGVDARLDEVVLRTLEKHPERRYQSAREVQTDISQIAVAPNLVPAQAPVKSLDSQATPGAEKYQSSTLKVIALILVGVLFSCVGLYCMTLFLTKLCFPVNDKYLTLLVFWLGMVTAAVGIPVYLFRLRLRREQLGKTRASLVDVLISYRGICYASLAILVTVFGMPWIRINYILPNNYATAIETWPGMFAMLFTLVTIMLIVFVDLKEGIRIRFGSLMLAIGFGNWLVMRLLSDSPNLGNMFWINYPSLFDRQRFRMPYCGGFFVYYFMTCLLMALGGWWYFTRLANRQLEAIGEFLRSRLLN